ncbi:MAG: SurA N-terminal domain-containing protein [Candidatus Cloacimonetes bacterium]|nr:SurA N-terminal domain-containing protein [Candidatus Cloacimonadota bacterium]
MNRILVLSVILIFCGMLGSVPVAWVDGEAIESSAFSEEVALLPDSLDVMEKRQMALDNLIERKLLEQYAHEEGITVTDDEVEGLFIKEFYDHPLFCTEGEFDYAKYNNLKDTDRIRLILDTMRKDILIEKTRELIARTQELGDDELLDRYIHENVSLDISYAEFALEDVSISRQLTAEGAQHYWQVHRKDFEALPEFKIGYALVPFSGFVQQAVVAADEFYEHVSPLELLPVEEIKDSLQLAEFNKSVELENQKRRDEAYAVALDSLTLAEAQQVRSLLKQEIPISYPKLTTGYIAENGKAGLLDENIMEQVSLMYPGEISQPYKLTEGYLLYWLIDHKPTSVVSLDEVKKKVWQSYISDQSFHSQEGEFRSYFFSHLDEFKVPAASVYRIELFQRKYGREWTLGEKRDAVITILERYLFNMSYMTSVARDNGLQVERRMLYMKRYHYRDKVDEMIAGAVKAGETYGIIENEGREYFYVLESYMPSYIPDFDDLSIGDYYGVEVENRYDEAHFRKYFESHLKDFDTADSIAVAGVHYRIDPEAVQVEDAEIQQYYQDNYSRYYHEDAVNCRFLVCTDWERAKLAYNYLRNGYDYELVRLGFADTEYEITDGTVEYERLPERLRNLLKGSMEYSVLHPIETEQGWLIISKISEIERGYSSLDDVRFTIRNRIAEYRADSLAYSQARAVFDSTTYYSDCFVYADKAVIFETPLQDIRQPYPEFGDIASYRAALLRLWRNEKLTRIIRTDTGYAVLFMRKKVTSKERSFEESLPQIKEILAANRQLELAQDYIQGIISDLKRGVEPDTLLYFLGGYKRLRNLRLSSSISGFEQSKILIDDMLKHEKGYYSPVLKIGDGRLMFYYINNINKISKSDFARLKSKYRQQVKQEDYKNWLQDYKEKKRIIIEM